MIDTCPARKTNGFLAVADFTLRRLSESETRCENQSHIAGCQMSFLAGSALLIGYIRVASRIEDWLTRPPVGGVRTVCARGRYCTFAREPERRRTGIEWRLTVVGVTHEITSEVAGETVVVWWGLFDQELWVEHFEKCYGPFDPIGGPVPFHRYAKHRKSRRKVRADLVDELATRNRISRSVLSGADDMVITVMPADVMTAMPTRAFVDPGAFAELTFANPLKARMVISEELRLPLGGLGMTTVPPSMRYSCAPCPALKSWAKSEGGSPCRTLPPPHSTTGSGVFSGNASTQKQR